MKNLSKEKTYFFVSNAITLSSKFLKIIYAGTGTKILILFFIYNTFFVDIKNNTKNLSKEKTYFFSQTL